MNTQLFLTVISSVFLAELGDKTQLATMLYAARSPGDKWTVFAGSALALVFASAMGVLAGEAISRAVEPRMLTRIAGVGFVVIGLWTLARA